MFTGVCAGRCAGRDGPALARGERLGSDRGKVGFFTMNDSWFSQYVFEIATRNNALPAALQSALDAEQIVLPAWDPMGALAR